jgi:hypothetical protein
MSVPMTIERASDSVQNVGTKRDENDAPNHDAARTLQLMTVEEGNTEAFDSPAKKSLAFKLAFVGLAATSFVFQIDATALGIALPVSHQRYLVSQFASELYRIKLITLPRQ